MSYMRNKSGLRLDSFDGSLSSRATLGIIGDSFDARCQTAQGTFGDPNSYFVYDALKGWLPWCLAFLGGRLRLVSNVAVAGTRSDEWISDGQVASMVATAPAWAFVGAPTNDREQSIALATTIGYMSAIFDTLAGAGIKIVVRALTPRSSMTAAQQQFTVAYNQWLKAEAWDRANFHVVDPFNLVASGGTSGNWVETTDQQWTQEGLHPLASSCARIGRAYANLLDPLVPFFDPRPAIGLDCQGLAGTVASVNVLNNAGLINGTSGTINHGGTGTLATGYVATSSTGTDYAGSVAFTANVPASDQSVLPWQQVAITGTASGVRVQQLSISAATGHYTPGTTKVRAEVEIDMDADLASGTKFTLGCQIIVPSGFTELRWTFDNGLFSPAPSIPILLPVENRLTADTRKRYPLLITPTMTIPATATTIGWYLDYTGLGTLRFRAPALRLDPQF